MQSNIINNYIKIVESAEYQVVVYISFHIVNHFMII